MKWKSNVIEFFGYKYNTKFLLWFKAYISSKSITFNWNNLSIVCAFNEGQKTNIICSKWIRRSMWNEDDNSLAKYWSTAPHFWFVLRCRQKETITMKNAVFWDVAPCRFCVNRCFGGTYRLHLQGRKIRERETSVSRWLQPNKIYTAPHPRRRHSSWSPPWKPHIVQTITRYIIRQKVKVKLSLCLTN
jgi:hypothetical protein